MGRWAVSRAKYKKSLKFLPNCRKLPQIAVMEFENRGLRRKSRLLVFPPVRPFSPVRFCPSALRPLVPSPRLSAARFCPASVHSFSPAGFPLSIFRDAHPPAACPPLPRLSAARSRPSAGPFSRLAGRCDGRRIYLKYFTICCFRGSQAVAAIPINLLFLANCELLMC